MLSKEEDMRFTRSTTDISVHQKLGDYPNQDNGLTPEELKKRYDLPAEQLQKDLNKLEEELEAMSGAGNVGAMPLDDEDESPNNIQAKIRQQLQLLRDYGYLAFVKRSEYKLL